jgi:hypothetical protein
MDRTAKAELEAPALELRINKKYGKTSVVLQNNADVL